ncbi:MAG: hemerythrin family protein [Methylovulum sp.]|nr:hemerythrin family protein [Methylovulum sp.]
MLLWSDTFATHIELVDTQHQKLFELLNSLSDCFKQGDPSEVVINGILEELIAYSDKHFVDEELLMAHSKIDPRHLNIHRMEHKSFIYDIKNMWEHLCTEDDLIVVSEKLIRFITSWLTFHILGTDQIMAAQLFAIQHGALPEQAYEARHTVKYGSAATRLMLDSVLDLWQMSVERCHQLEEKLAALNIVTNAAR